VFYTVIETADWLNTIWHQI